VIVKCSTFEIFGADLTQDHYFWAFTLQMVFKLTSCHMLELWESQSGVNKYHIRILDIHHTKHASIILG
jgi:hypothetical protein